MKLFQSVQSNLAVCGIFPIQSVPTQSGFNWKMFKVAFFQGLECVLSCLFFVYGAHTFREYTVAIYMTSATIMVTLYFVILVLKMAQLFEFIDSFEKIINESE